MSKKSRKKSPKTPPRRASAAKSPAAKKSKSAKSRSPATKSLAHATGGPSHKGASKRLKSSHAKAPPKPLAAKKSTTKSSAVEKPSVLAEGAKAPAFSLPRDGGSHVSLSDFAGQKLVLFFYPRADTPGCTREAIDFTRLSAKFADSGTAVLGISGDAVKAQEKFRDKHKLSVPLISDEKHEMLEAYGAWGEKSMYGKTFMGIVRTTVLVGADGRVARVWRHVKVDGHADAVLEAARALET